jgi:tetratricopeptide (TPR) repeat protein
MRKHLDRALMLLNQSRPDLAEQELRQALGADPDDGIAHALLALCLAQRKAYAEATEEAEAAVHLAPDHPFPHYVLASVLHERHRDDEAAAAVREAIRLNPEDADAFALLASIRFQQRDWEGARRAAERGLRIDPENDRCANLRAMALVKLGRRAEAEAAIEGALARDPENAVTHANQGWVWLERSEPQKALEHFREALRLNPTLEWARAGLIEALKARYLIYRLMLRYFLWMAKLSAGARWGIILGGFVGFRVLRGAANANPELAPYLWPLLGAYLAFVVLSWIADPLFNLLLRVNRFGRLALSREEIIASNWIGACLAGGLAALGVGLATGSDTALLVALSFGLLIIPLSATFNCAEGWPRTIMALYTAGLAACGLLALGLFLADSPLMVVPVVLFFIGTMFSTLVANIIMPYHPER